MRIRLDKTLRFWLDADYGRVATDSVSRHDFYRSTLFEWESVGQAMRHLDRNGKIAWKASPRMLERLAEQELEARLEMEDDAI